MNLTQELKYINARVIERPLTGCRGSVDKLDDGYLILVEESLTDEKKYWTIMHEYFHIILGHVDEMSYLPESLKERQVKAMLTSIERCYDNPNP